MIVAEAFAQALQRHGVEVIFSQCFPVRTQHVLPKYGIRQIGFRTENAGGAMADGYARITRRIAVVAAQSGPGATLLVPPLAECLTASVPVLAIVEESARGQADRNAFQEFDHLKLFEGCAKWVRRVDRADRLDDYVDMAIVKATSGRPGPVVLIFPSDFLGEPAVPSTRTARLGDFPLDRTTPEQALLTEAAQALATAQRPLIIAGGGVHLSGASEALETLAELGAFPVATTNMGKGAFDESSSLALGVFGNCMEQGAPSSELRDFAAEADLILFVGCRTNANATDGWRLFPSTARIIHIDIDSLEIGRNYEALRLAGDAKATLSALTAELTGLDLSHRKTERERIGARVAGARAASAAYVAEEITSVQGHVRPEHMLRILNDRLSPQDIVTADASYATNWVSTYLSGRMAGARFLEPRGLAGLGWGFPIAIGAKLARPGAKVVSVVGDGGFAHCWSELETIRRLNIKVVIIVLNNQILGYQRHGEEWVFKTHSDAADLSPVDHAAIARACDCFGERVDTIEGFGAALDRAFADPRPALLDVMTDIGAHPPLSLFAGKTKDVAL